MLYSMSVHFSVCTPFLILLNGVPADVPEDGKQTKETVMPIVRMARVAAICAGLLALMGLVCKTAEAKPEFARKEGQNCLFCHVVPGGPRNFRGIYYRKHNLSFVEFDNVFEAKAAGVSPDAKGGDAAPTNPDYPNVKVPTALNFTLKDIDGKPVKLARYEGSVILAVN